MDKSSSTFSIKLPNEVRQQLEEIAEKEYRTLSNLVMKYIKEGIERDSK